MDYGRSRSAGRLLNSGGHGARRTGRGLTTFSSGDALAGPRILEFAAFGKPACQGADDRTPPRQVPSGTGAARSRGSYASTRPAPRRRSVARRPSRARAWTVSLSRECRLSVLRRHRTLRFCAQAAPRARHLCPWLTGILTGRRPLRSPCGLLWVRHGPGHGLARLWSHGPSLSRRRHGRAGGRCGTARRADLMPSAPYRLDQGAPTRSHSARRRHSVTAFTIGRTSSRVSGRDVRGGQTLRVWLMAWESEACVMGPTT